MQNLIIFRTQTYLTWEDFQITAFEMEEQFDFAIIVDHFDESLILLKRLLCWEFEDSVYIKLREKKEKLEFEEEVKKNIFTWNHADVKLFDHFNRTFWRKV